MSIPLSVGASHDMLIWVQNDDGNFSIKSCYKSLIGNFLDVDIAKQTQCCKLKIPPIKIKLFFWQACAGCTPTTDALRKKNIECPSLCQWCKREDETLIHIMYECEVSKNVWNCFPMVLPRPNSQSFAKWAMYLFDQLSKYHMSLFITYCWSLWRARNEVWKNRAANVHMIVERATCYLHDRNEVVNEVNQNYVEGSVS